MVEKKSVGGSKALESTDELATRTSSICPLTLNKILPCRGAHLAGLTIHFLRGFSFHREFHLRKLFEVFGCALPEELCSPLVCDTASAEWMQFYGSSAVATPTFLSAPP
jgi:hypothetical protein